MSTPEPLTSSGPDRARPKVTVVGSANQDVMYRVERLPQPGETLTASHRQTSAGGKGLNQVIAAARTGAQATFIGAIGADPAGDTLLSVLAGAAVIFDGRRVSAPTGSAAINVDDHTENAIVVYPGANAELLTLTPPELHAVADTDVLLLQLEIPSATVTQAAIAARQADRTVILNAAPINDLGPDLLTCIDVLVVNESEATILARQLQPTTTWPTRLDITSATKIARTLARAVPTVVVTLGKNGAVVAGADLNPVHLPAPAVKAVDTTGAGDTFCGALATQLGRGRDIVTAARFATVAASLAVQKHGSVASIPTSQQIDTATAAQSYGAHSDPCQRVTPDEPR